MVKKKVNITKEQIKIEELASKIQLLFGFCGALIKDKELILKCTNIASDQQNYAMSAAVLIEACGGDYQEDELEARIVRDRGKALYDLVCVLDQTEKDRGEFKGSQEQKKKVLKQLRGFM